MFTEIYVEALLVDEELADQVWEAWDKGRSAISGRLGFGGRLLKISWNVRFPPETGHSANIGQRGRL